MIGWSASVAGFGLVLVMAWRGRPRPARPAPGGSTSRRAPASGRLGERVVPVLAAVSVWWAVGPTVLVVVVVIWFGVHRSRRFRSEHRRRAAVEAALPDLIDLFAIAASAGHPVPASLAAVGPRAPAVVRPMVLGARERFARGIPLATTLRRMSDELGPSAHPLTDALLQATSSGAPLAPLLDAVAHTARDQRRRQAQEAARRLPVTMLLPLVACILPAAVLLAVVPVLLVSLASLNP